MFIIFSSYSYENSPENLYLFETIVEPNTVRTMFDEFKSRYDVDESPTLDEFEEWLDELVAHHVIKPVQDWDVFDIEVNGVNQS